jgi:hypothetical protein
MTDRERIELSEGRYLVPVDYARDNPVRVVGYQEHHPRPDNGLPCGGFIWIDASSEAHVDGPVWKVEQRDPLTLSPSVKCRSCGNHGFVRNGKWVPA